MLWWVRTFVRNFEGMRAHRLCAHVAPPVRCYLTSQRASSREVSRRPESVRSAFEDGAEGRLEDTRTGAPDSAGRGPSSPWYRTRGCGVCRSTGCCEGRGPLPLQLDPIPGSVPGQLRLSFSLPAQASRSSLRRASITSLIHPPKPTKNMRHLLVVGWYASNPTIHSPSTTTASSPGPSGDASQLFWTARRVACWMAVSISSTSSR